MITQVSGGTQSKPLVDNINNFHINLSKVKMCKEIIQTGLNNKNVKNVKVAQSELINLRKELENSNRNFLNHFSSILSQHQSNLNQQQNLQNISNGQNLQNPQQNLQQNIQQNIQNLQNIQNIQNFQNLQNLQNLQIPQSPQNPQNSQNIQIPLNSQNQQNTLNHQNPQKLPNPQRSVTLKSSNTVSTANGICIIPSNNNNNNIVINNNDISNNNYNNNINVNTNVNKYTKPQQVRSPRPRTVRSERSVRTNSDKIENQCPVGNPLDIWVKSAPLFTSLPTEEDINEICKAIEIDYSSKESTSQHWSEKLRDIVQETKIEIIRKNKRNILDPPGPPPAPNASAAYWDGRMPVFPMTEAQRHNNDVVHCLLSAFVKTEPTEKIEEKEKMEEEAHYEDREDDEFGKCFFNCNRSNGTYGEGFSKNRNKGRNNENDGIEQKSFNDNIENENIENENNNEKMNNNNKENVDNKLEKNNIENNNLENYNESDNENISDEYNYHDEDNKNKRGRSKQMNEDNMSQAKNNNEIYPNHEYIPTHIPAPQIEYDDYLSYTFEEKLEFELLAAGIKRPAQRNGQFSNNVFSTEIEQFKEELSRLQPQIDCARNEIMCRLPEFRHDEERRKSELHTYNEMMREFKKRSHKK